MGFGNEPHPQKIYNNIEILGWLTYHDRPMGHYAKGMVTSSHNRGMMKSSHIAEETVTSCYSAEGTVPSFHSSEG